MWSGCQCSVERALYCTKVGQQLILVLFVYSSVDEWREGKRSIIIADYFRCKDIRNAECVNHRVEILN